MEQLVHTFDSILFGFEQHVWDNYGPPDRDENADNICKFFLRGHCPRGSSCPQKHTKGDKAIVCKHWLRGLCKKDDTCEFLHEYNLKKMPECWFFSKYGECNNPECMYQHVNPDAKGHECIWYARGFCKHGPKCRHRHVKRAPCPLYLTGFCPDGLTCKLGHPKYELVQQHQDRERKPYDMPVGRRMRGERGRSPSPERLFSSLQRVV